MKRLVQIGAACLAILFTIPTARAELIYGIGTPGTDPSALTLFSFDSASPGTFLSSVAVSGVTTNFNLVAIDFRPSTGQLYGFGFNPAAAVGTANAQVFTLDITTGVASAVGVAFDIGSAQGQNGDSFGVGFNPAVDLIRVVTGNQSNFRVNPNTGALVAFDTDLVYASGDPNENNTYQVSAADYTAGAALFNIDYLNNVLAQQNPPNSGTLTTIGGLGITTLGPGTMGFDISNLSGIAYLQTDTDADGDVQDTLYTINLGTGAATLVGNIGTNTAFNTYDISVVPEPSTYALLATGALLGALWLRRHRHSRAHSA
jgi:hypothetical protein